MFRVLGALFLFSFFTFTVQSAYACTCSCVTGDGQVVSRSDRLNAQDCAGYCQYTGAVTGSIGLTPRGCPGPAGGPPNATPPTPLVRILHFHGGCISIFENGMYWNPTCQYPRGGPGTINAWNVPEPYYEYVQAMVIFNDCVFTAFSGGGIYKSCNGINLGGGGDTVRVYQAAPPNAIDHLKVRAMTVVPYQGRDVLRTLFYDGSVYCDPTGDNPGGGPGVDHCDHPNSTPTSPVGGSVAQPSPPPTPPVSANTSQPPPVSVPAPVKPKPKSIITK